METVLVAVGSQREPKLHAVSEALKTLGPMLDPGARFEVVGIAVPSGVAHTPLSRAELMAGARGRVRELRRMAAESGAPWRYFVGLEGGLDVVWEDGVRMAFLESWACVSDATDRTAYGHAGGVLLPAQLANEVVDRGAELSVAIDAYAGGRGIRDAQGTWGVLTRNLITRQDAFRTAVIHAFAPFYNAALYAGAPDAQTGRR
jgi:inosine/xanthosine triphosphatase